MRYLLDTHTLLWWMSNDKRLKASVKKTIENPDNYIYTSVVNAWEIAIKLKSKPEFKIQLPLKDWFDRTTFEIIDIKLKHVLKLRELPLRHQDPFDRMLIAQALVEKFIFITSDPKITKYNLPIIKT